MDVADEQKRCRSSGGWVSIKGAGERRNLHSNSYSSLVHCRSETELQGLSEKHSIVSRPTTDFA